MHFWSIKPSKRRMTHRNRCTRHRSTAMLFVFPSRTSQLPRAKPNQRTISAEKTRPVRPKRTRARRNRGATARLALTAALVLARATATMAGQAASAAATRALETGTLTERSRGDRALGREREEPGKENASGQSANAGSETGELDEALRRAAAPPIDAIATRTPTDGRVVRGRPRPPPRPPRHREAPRPRPLPRLALAHLPRSRLINLHLHTRAPPSCGR